MSKHIYHLTVKPEGVVELREELEGIQGQWWRTVCDTRENMVRDGLRMLGWLPPCDAKRMTDQRAELINALKAAVETIETLCGNKPHPSSQIMQTLAKAEGETQ